MALTHSKKVYLHLSKYGKTNLFPALFQGNSFGNFLSVAHFSDSNEVSRGKLSSAMKAYLEKAEKYGSFMKEQLEEYNLGKKFLTNMMGKKELMTEKEIEEAIDYLFPSALFVPKSRPIMKPPEKVFEKQKEAVFDNTGRPFHFLFYTGKPNFSLCLHDAAVVLENLNKQLKKIPNDLPDPGKKLNLVGQRWFTKEELEKEFLEKVYDLEYEKFQEVFNRLLDHPLSLNAEEFIKKYTKEQVEEFEILEEVKTLPEVGDKKVIKVEGTRKKTCFADVIVTSPGTGKIEINNMGLDYFDNIQRREQVSGI